MAICVRAGVFAGIVLVSLILTISCLIFYTIRDVHNVTWCGRIHDNPSNLGMWVSVLSLIGLTNAMVVARTDSQCGRRCLFLPSVLVTLMVITNLTSFAFALTKTYDLNHHHYNWDENKEACQIETRSSICSSLGSPTQSDCCRPPVECGFQYQNTTRFWIVPKSGPIVNNSDCSTWSNDQTKLCYDCNSCKARVVGDLKRGWMVATILLGCMLFMEVVTVVAMLLISCCMPLDSQDYDNTRTTLFV